MNLKSMKMTKEETKSMIEPCAIDKDAPRYPYGLNIRLDSESMKKLGIESLPKVGTKVQIMAIANVESVSERDSQDGGKHRDMCLQITDLGLEPQAEKKDAASALYGAKA